MTINWMMPAKRAVVASWSIRQLPQFEFRGIQIETMTEVLDTGQLVVKSNYNINLLVVNGAD